MKLTDASGFKLGSYSVLAIYSGGTKVYPTIGTTPQTITISVVNQLLYTPNNVNGYPNRLIAGFGYQDIQVTSTSNLPVNFSIISGSSGVLSYRNSNIWRLYDSDGSRAATFILQATQAGDPTYAPATANYSVYFRQKGVAGQAKLAGQTAG